MNELKFSHAFCDNCNDIEEVFSEELSVPSTLGEFIGGDVVCKTCASIVVCVYNRRIQ